MGEQAGDSVVRDGAVDGLAVTASVCMPGLLASQSMPPPTE